MRGLLVIASVVCACTAEHHTNLPDASAMDARTTDARTTDAHVDSSVPSRWIATKTTLDVWWQGAPVHDPGRAEIEIYTLTHVADACDDAASETTIKICGITLPPYTSDVICTAHQLEIASSAWDSPNMPTFTARSITDAGDMASKVATALVGIDRADGTEHDAWPMLAASVTCEAGTGSNCFPDHDSDTFAGVTARLRTDAEVYVGPYDDGLCWNGTPYTYRGVATTFDACAGCGTGGGIAADRLHLGIGTTLGGVSGFSDCANPSIDAVTSLVELRAAGCTVDPATVALYQQVDDRHTTMNYACRPTEAEFVDTYLPQFRALAAGQRPGESLRPLGWTFEGRDREIDKRVSDGTRTASVPLNVDDIDAGSDGEPSCAQVRAVFHE